MAGCGHYRKHQRGYGYIRSISNHEWSFRHLTVYSWDRPRIRGSDIGILSWLWGQGPVYATVNYYEPPLDELTPPDEETKEYFEEAFPEREVAYGTLYVEPSVISIEVYQDGFGGIGDDVEIIDIAGHEVQYQFLKKEQMGKNRTIYSWLCILTM